MGKEKWYTVTEAAGILGVSDETVRNHIKSGRLAGARKKSPIPRSPYLVPKSSIDSYKRSRYVNSK